MESISWTDLLVAGAGGGAVYGVADSFIAKFLPAEAKIAGMTLKDIALIVLGKYGADRTTGYLSTALMGMGVIGVYKVIYPQFIEPLIKGLLPGGGSSSHSSHNPVMTAERAAQAYVATRR